MSNGRGSLEADKHFSFLCSSRIRASGAVCSRHCRALLRKQVLPVLLKPRPTLEFGGQVVSIGLVCNSLRPEGPAAPLLDTCVFLSEGDSTATFLPSEGDCGGNVCNDVVNFSKLIDA